MTGYYVDGGRDADGPRRDTWIPTRQSSGGSSSSASGCDFAIPQAAAVAVRLLFAATLARVRRIGGAW